MGRRSGAFGAFAAAATTPAKTGAFSRFADEAPGDAPKRTPARTKGNSPAPELSLDEVRRLLEELRTVSNSAKFQKDLAELRRMDWGAFKKREAVAKLLSIFWKATLRKHGFSIDGAGFPNLLQVVKEHGHQPGIRLVSHEVERQLRMVPGALFRLTASTNGEGKSWKQEEIETSRKILENPSPAPTSTKNRQEAFSRQIRGRPMFLGEAKEILKAFKESLLTPAVVRTMQNIEQRGGMHMEQHRRVLITQEWNPIMKRFDFPTTEDGYTAMKSGIREFADNDYVRSCCHEVEHLCGAPAGAYFGVPTAEEWAARKAAEAEAARAEERRKEEEAEAKRKAEESRKAEERRKAEEAKRHAEAKKKAEEDRQRAEAEAKQKAEAEAEAQKHAEEEARRKAEAEAEAQKRAEEEARSNLEAESRRRAEEESQKAEAEQTEQPELSQTEVPKSAEDGQAQVQAQQAELDGEELRAESSCEPAVQGQADELERLAEEARQRAAKLRRADEARPDSPRNEPESGRDTAGHPAEKAEEAEAGKSQQEEESHVQDAAKPVSPDSAKDSQAKGSNLKEERHSNFFHEEPHCFDVAHQVPLWEQPSKESRLVGAASKGAQLLGAIQESTGGQQWLHVSSRCCHALGALADSAWALINELNLVPAVERQPQALGYAGRYEVAHGKVAVRASPSLKGKIIGVVHEGRILMGTPHKVGGYAWLRFEESSRKKLADIGEEAWALIDGEPLGLQELLRPLDNDGRKTLESFHAKQVEPEEASQADLTVEGPAEKQEKTDGASEGKHEAKDCKKDSKKEPDAKHDAKEATTTAISDPAKVESRMKAAQQARDVLSGPIEYKVLAQDHAAPVRQEPLVQSPEVGKLERGRLVLGYPGGGWLQLAAVDDVEKKMHGCWVFIGTRLSAQWAELNITGEFEGALELSWLGLRKEKRVAYNVEWRTPEGAPNPKKGHKISAANKVLVSGLPQGCELSFRVGARVAADGDQDDKDVRLWGSWTQLLTGQFS